MEAHNSKVFETPEYLDKLFHEIAESEGFENYVIEKSAGSNHGDGFLAIVVRVSIIGKRKSSTVDEKMALICKLMPTSAARREQFNSKLVFEREALLYNTILPIFAKFQKEKGIHTDEMFLQYPKCYAAYADEETERFAIVMEDLKVNGYELWNKLNPVDFTHVKLFIESLGRFHAISFAMKDQQPEIFNQFKELEDLFVQQVESNVEMMQGMFKYALDRAAKAMKPEEEKEREVVQGIRENFMERLMSAVKLGAAEPFSVINHGDCWNNNMMYQYKDETKVPQKICLLDWQISRYGSPVLDIVYFMFSSTDGNLRANYFDEILKLYHKSLSTTLTKLGSDAEKLFSWNDLQNQLKQFGVYGFVLAPVLLQIITAPPADLPDLDDFAEKMADKTMSMEESLELFSSASSETYYNERVSDVVRDCVRLGYY